ncbi:pyridine nucleotide-disulfide oxidoreductase [Candidatus Woesearchaeota archaeon CG10_big_fil_rev_8_21_14_0_10_37_12]|nr:MAG: pyridine nucleotide-disulfide oxidoreductase [Candidatus Woesearchaeota archaeon CG10_big_fil_rev_8_21_14_0_10_37_12]
MKYDLVIIGGGSAGLTIAAGATKLGAKVALVEKHKLGGECLWTGCVPSKALIRAAEVAHTINTADAYGFKKNSAQHTFSNVIDYVQHVIKKIEPHDSPERFKKLGVHVFFGNAQFKDKQTLFVDKKELKAKNFVISTGSSPATLPIPGLEKTGYLTNETLFTNKTFPKEFLVIGGGPIGAEMAQAFSRLGSNVTVFARSGLISKEDTDVSLELENAFEKEGIRVIKNMDLVKFEKKNNKKIVHYKIKNKKYFLSGDEILLSTGRTPNMQGLNLEGIGVETTKKGIVVNEKLQTRVKHIYAAGDVTGGYQFTHVASYEAGIILINTLFKFPKKADYSVIPWTTFTDPEVARVGITEQEAKEKNIEHDILKLSFKDVDRAQAENQTTGFTKLVVDKKGKLLGAHIIGARAGELLPEFVLAMRKKLKITDIFNTIHTYPTLSSMNQQVAGKFYEKKLSPRIKKILQFIFRFG